MGKAQDSIRFYDFGPFRVDVAGRQLLRSGQVISLTPKAFETLSVLVQNAGAVVEKQDLLNAVWPGVSVDEGILSVNIASLRKALSEESVASSYIETVPRRGYKFVADVRKLRDEPNGKGRRLVALIGMSAIAVLSLAIWRWPSQKASSWPPLRAEPLTSYAGSEMKPSFSPDGSQVAFSWSGEQQDNYDIYVKVLNAGPSLRLTRDPAPDVAPAWSPDGRQIAFVRNRAVFLISPLGGAERRLAEVDAGHLAWTPDSRAIAANSSRHGIVVISSETGDIHPLTAPPASAVMGDLVFAFSPDGKNLAFARFSTATTADLFILPDPLSSSRSTERKIFSSGQGVYGLAWTPDGRELIYATGRTPFQAGFYRLKIDGNSPVPTPMIELGENVAEPATWLGKTRETSKLAFERRRFDQNIWKIDNLGTPGAATTRTVASTRMDGHPHISPDGRRIAFVSDRSGTLQVWASDADGNNPAQVTFLAEDHVVTNAPRWSPDGAFIAFASMARGNRDIYIVPVGGGRVRRFTDELSEEGRPSWSKDGRWIYYYSTRSGAMEIWKKPVNEGVAVQITQGGGHEAFEAPGGEHVFYSPPFERGVWTVSTKGEKQAGEPVRGLEAVNGSFWAVADAGIYFMDLGERFAIHQRYDPHAVVMSLASWSTKSRTPVRFFDFRTRRVSEVTAIEANVNPSGGGFDVARNGGTAVWAQIDFSESDLLLVEHFR